MATTSFGPFTVVGGEVSTGINVLAGDSLQISSSGFVNFGGDFLGFGAPILSADGDNWLTPLAYPAPLLKKNSLIFRIGSQMQWFQAGVMETIIIPFGQSGEIFFRANDGIISDNSRGWTVNVLLTREDPPVRPPGVFAPNLQIVSIELIQCVQHSDNSIRLVGNKRTMVRLFVDSGVTDGTDVGAGPNRWTNVFGEITVTDPSNGRVVQTQQRGPFDVRPLAEIDRGTFNHAMNFELSLRAIGLPSVSISARVFVQHHENDNGGWTATRSTTFAFVTRPVQPVLPILIRDLFSNVTTPTPAEYLTALTTSAIPRLPVAENGFFVNTPRTVASFLDLTTPAAWTALMTQLCMMGFTGPGTNGIRTAVVAGGLSYPYGGMGLPRLAFTIPSLIAVVSDPTAFAHEMGHVFGLGHSRCRGDEPTPIDSALPVNGRTDEIGMNVSTRTLLPAGTPEIMSYCGGGSVDQWPSVAFYNIMFDSSPI